MKDTGATRSNVSKFQDPKVTANGQTRAQVALSHPTTLWFNTGTLCNIACANCYIESSPTNDALVFINADEVSAYLDQIAERGWPAREIAFTGGEPFMNPQMIDMAGRALERGYEVLILTNAMRPMMRPSVLAGLRDLRDRYRQKLTLRISLDHYLAHLHDTERGAGAFEKTLQGMAWLRDAGIRMSVAGRTVWQDTEAQSRAGFGRLFETHGFDIPSHDPTRLVLFPEMDETADVPEITTECWSILGKSPDAVMCSSSRMVVKRKGADAPVVLACTLIAYDQAFELGPTLADAERPVPLNHPHCAKFCVLGGASCSA